MPKSFAFWIFLQTSAFSSSDLVGMQPRCRQVPPRNGSFSMTADLEPELAGADAGDVAARTAADDDDVVLLFCHEPSVFSTGVRSANFNLGSPRRLKFQT